MDIKSRITIILSHLSISNFLQSDALQIKVQESENNPKIVKMTI